MKAVAFALIAIAAGAMLASCGGSAPAQPAGSIKVTMTEFHFDPSTISTPPGKVVFFLVNGGNSSHDLVIRDAGGNRVNGSELISAGDSIAFTVDNLGSGTYSYFCDQPGHESSGMKGTLTVT